MHWVAPAEIDSATGADKFVMANSASDARSFEQELLRQLIESCAVDVMVTALAAKIVRSS